MGLGYRPSVFVHTNAMLALCSKHKFSAKNITHLTRSFLKKAPTPPKTLNRVINKLARNRTSALPHYLRKQTINTVRTHQLPPQINNQHRRGELCSPAGDHRSPLRTDTIFSANTIPHRTTRTNNIQSGRDRRPRRSKKTNGKNIERIVIQNEEHCQGSFRVGAPRTARSKVWGFPWGELPTESGEGERATL